MKIDQRCQTVRCWLPGALVEEATIVLVRLHLRRAVIDRAGPGVHAVAEREYRDPQAMF